MPLPVNLPLWFFFLRFPQFLDCFLAFGGHRSVPPEHSPTSAPSRLQLIMLPPVIAGLFVAQALPGRKSVFFSVCKALWKCATMEMCNKI